MKNKFLLTGFLVLSVFAVLFSSCKEKPTDEPKDVTGVTLSETTLTLEIDQTATLTATVAPSDAENKAVTWTSSNAGVATVSDNGLVTAITEGNAVITVTTVSGNKTATCNVTVNAPAPPPPPAEGCVVTFGTETWTAAMVQASDIASYSLMDFWAFKVDESTLPLVNFVAPNQTGTMEYAEDGDLDMEYYEAYVLTDGQGTQYGDWWVESGTLEITSYDANGTVSGTVNATMFDAYSRYIDGATEYERREMTIAFSNIPMSTVAKMQNALKASVKRSSQPHSLRVAR